MKVTGLSCVLAHRAHRNYRNTLMAVLAPGTRRVSARLGHGKRARLGVPGVRAGAMAV
jgi:hypothetical protein